MWGEDRIIGFVTEPAVIRGRAHPVRIRDRTCVVLSTFPFRDEPARSTLEDVFDPGRG